MEPPVSVPRASGTTRLATAAADPPLDPPVMRIRSHGLAVGPHAEMRLVAPIGQLVLVRLADDDGAGFLQALDDRSVCVCHVALVDAAAAARLAAGHIEEILDRHRNPGERSISFV